jgi:hypothetical protein
VPVAGASAVANAAPAPAGTGSSLPSRDQLTVAWGDQILSNLPQRAKVRFAGGHWVRVEDGVAVFGLPNPVHASRCEECRADVEAALAQHFGTAVPIRLVVDGDGPDPSAPHLSVAPPPPGDAPGDESSIDPGELTDAPEAATSGLDRIAAIFPGAEIVTDDDA